MSLGCFCWSDGDFIRMNLPESSGVNRQSNKAYTRFSRSSVSFECRVLFAYRALSDQITSNMATAAVFCWPSP